MAEIERVMLGDDGVALVIRGELDMADESRLDLAVDFVVGLGAAGMVLDLSACEFIDAASLRMLLRARERVLRSGARVAAVGPMRPVLRVLELAGVTELLTGHDTRDGAAGSLQAAPA